MQVVGITTREEASRCLRACGHSHLGFIAAQDEGFTRLKSRMITAWDEESKNAHSVYARLGGWFALDYSYADYLRWPSSIADLSGNDVGQIAAAFSGAGRIVTGILEPASEETSK
jgi:hypothetical protein